MNSDHTYAEIFRPPIFNEQQHLQNVSTLQNLPAMYMLVGVLEHMFSYWGFLVACPWTSKKKWRMCI